MAGAEQPSRVRPATLEDWRIARAGINHTSLNKKYQRRSSLRKAMENMAFVVLAGGVSTAQACWGEIASLKRIVRRRAPDKK